MFNFQTSIEISMIRLTAIFLVPAFFEFSGNAFKILIIYPMPLYSHQLIPMALAEGLVKKGHDVFVVSPNTMPGVKHNYTHVDVSLSDESNSAQEENKVIDLERQISKWDMLEAFTPVASIPEKQFKTEPFLQFRKRVQVEHMKFDAAILESFFIPFSCAMIRLLGGRIPLISLTNIPVEFSGEESVGSIQHLSYIPSTFESYTHNMNLWQKIDNWISHHYIVSQWKALVEASANSFFKENYGHEYESLVSGCWNNLSLVMVPTNFLYYYPRLLSPNVIEFGPIHITPVQKLPKILQEWLDGAEKGVIYFALGSNMKSRALPEVARSNFLKVFQELSPAYRVLWKWEQDGHIPGQSDNILTQKWVPQQSVLAHPKVKVFITQGGLQSFQEAVHFGVPTVGIPWFGDQNTNVAKMVDAEIGVGIQPKELVSYEKVSSAIKAVLHDERYSKNMKKLSAISHDFTAQAMDKAIFWVEHVARHGGAAHLRPSTADTTYFEFFCLDIISVILVLTLGVSYIMISVLKLIISIVSKKLLPKIKEA